MLAFCAVTLLAGCGAQPHIGQQVNPREVVLAGAQMAKEAGSEEQYEALRDGEVTFEEYDAAFDSLADCYEAAGLGITPPVINPVDGSTYLFQMIPNGLDPDLVTESQAECDNAHWLFVSSAYSTVTPAKMDEALRVAVLACLDKRGFETSGDESNLGEIVRVELGPDRERVDAAVACIGEEVFVLYPDLPPVNIGF